ncbi:MAG TPA: RhuM family protein [Candidatus Dormibacteraeota bacterium]|nr:RhuM family protein [Candidatus Dormibacteraeota bacterium]
MTDAPGSDRAGEIVVYEAPDGESRVEVVVGDETVWLTQAEMGKLFARDRTVITRHIGNVFRENELDREGNVQILHIASGGDRPTTLYNLDVIISVGYRVKSKRGTQFRVWATRTLRNHLIEGYTLNERRLRARGVEAEQAFALISSTLRHQQLVTDEGQAVLDIADARDTIRVLREDIIARGEAPGLFGQERGDGLRSILLNIEQTWEGEPLYPIASRDPHIFFTS